MRDRSKPLLKREKDFIKYVDNVETLIAHNISFELRHLPKSIKFKNHLCTMKANTRILNLKKTNGHLKPPKLTETCEFYAIKPDSRKIHTASYDTYLLLRILKKMEFESLSDLYVEELERKNKSNIVKPKLRKSKSRESCPKCGSSNTIKRGFKIYKTGKSLQRYSCNSCRHTFTSNSISSNTCRNTSIDTPSFEYNQQTKDLIRSIEETHERNENLNTLKLRNRTPKKEEPAYSNYDIQVIKPPSGVLRELPKKFIFKQKTHSIYHSLYIINYRPAIFRKIMFFLTPSAFQRFARFLYYMVFILMTGDTQ